MESFEYEISSFGLLCSLKPGPQLKHTFNIVVAYDEIRMKYNDSAWHNYKYWRRIKSKIFVRNNLVKSSRL